MAVYSVGRFQPPTIGHAAMIEALIKTGKPAFVFVSSSESPKAKNPLTSAEKVKFLEKMFPRGVTFVNTATCDPPCGGPIAAREYLVKRGFVDITLIGGSDREAEFGPRSRIWDYLQKPEYEGPRDPPKFLALKRDATDVSSSTAAKTMSGTKARGFAVAGDLANFTAAVKMGAVTDKNAKDLYDLLRQRLGTKRGGTDRDEEISLFDADNELLGGRRKRTRRNRRRQVTRRQSASGKA